MEKIRRHDLRVVKLPIDSLRLIPNPRVHPEREIEAIIESIRKYGFYAPLFVAGNDNTLLAGYARLEALKRLGFKEVEVIKLNVKPEEYSLLMIIDNRLQEMGSWNYQLFIDLIEKNVDLGSSLTVPPELGMTSEELQDLRRWLDDAMSNAEGMELSDVVENPIPQSPDIDNDNKTVSITLVMPMQVWERIRVELESDLVSLTLKFKELKIQPPKIKKSK